ncbi:MAG: hypothetical protein KC503_26370 [Myxococcales bacterium]|nr:hypothetical protein [Myxococcales bacterium]
MRSIRTFLLCAALALVALLGASSGCYQIDLTGEGKFLCRDDSRECPDGYACRTSDGVCIRSASSSQSITQTSDGGSGDGVVNGD